MNHANLPEPSDEDQTPLQPGFTTQQRSDANQGIDSPLARLLAWLGNHFFAVTLVLTGALLVWAIGFSGR